MTSAEKRVGIIGVGGYTGSELLRFVVAHPRLKLAWVAGHSNAGKRLGDVLPSVIGTHLSQVEIEAVDPDHIESWSDRADIVFSCLPHGHSARISARFFEANCIVVDLSADFRLHDLAVYEKWYGEHPVPALLAEARYGLPELHREALRGARLIASPGCYPTSCVLPLAPLLQANLISTDSALIVDAKSGVSGAGRSASAVTHLPEASEGLRAYKLAGTHRHTPEIEQELSEAAGTEVKVVFTPHLVPMTRGILSVSYARPKARVTAKDCSDAARQLYGDSMVGVLEEGRSPDTLWVRGSSRAHISYALDERTETLLALGAIDNLAKGAAGQALQALNVALDWPEGLGLPLLGTFP